MSDGWHVAAAAGHSVWLHAPAPEVAQVAALADPWVRLEPAEGGPSAGAPSVVAADGGAAGDLAAWEETLEGEQTRSLRVDAARRRVLVACDDPAWLPLQLLRTVRNLLRWEALRAGAPCLHAGLVALRGAGLAVAGAKRAGKTSTIVTALTLAGAAFISNDDLTLLDDGDGWQGVGWPRSVNLRADAVAALCATSPRFRSVAALRSCSRHPSRRGSTDGDYTVLPTELCAAAGASLRASAPLRAILLPRFASGGVALRRLPRAEAVEALRPHVDRVATDHDDYLRDWYGERSPAQVAAAAERLADTVPCFTLRHRLEEAHDVAEALAGLAAALTRTGEREVALGPAS